MRGVCECAQIATRHARALHRGLHHKFLWATQKTFPWRSDVARVMLHFVSQWRNAGSSASSDQTSRPIDLLQEADNLCSHEIDFFFFFLTPLADKDPISRDFHIGLKISLLYFPPPPPRHSIGLCFDRADPSRSFCYQSTNILHHEDIYE